MKLSTQELNTIVVNSKQQISQYKLKALFVKKGTQKVGAAEAATLHEVLFGKVKWWYNYVFDEVRPMTGDQIDAIPYDNLGGEMTNRLWMPLCTTEEGFLVR